MLIKYIFFILTPVALVTSGTVKPVFVNVDPEKVVAFSNVFMDCTGKIGIDLETVQRLRTWNIEDRDIVKKYLYCITKNSGYGDENGHLIKEKMVELVGNHPRRNDYANNIDECNKEKGSDKYDTAFKTVICFRDKSPLLFKL